MDKSRFVYISNRGKKLQKPSLRVLWQNRGTSNFKKLKALQNKGFPGLGSNLYTHINYTVVLSGLFRETYQIVLFNDTEEMLSLYQAMERMKTHYGFDVVRRCPCVFFKPNNKDEILKRKK